MRKNCSLLLDSEIICVNTKPRPLEAPWQPPKTTPVPHYFAPNCKQICQFLFSKIDLHVFFYHIMHVLIKSSKSNFSYFTKLFFYFTFFTKQLIGIKVWPSKVSSVPQGLRWRPLPTWLNGRPGPHPSQLPAPRTLHGKTNASIAVSLKLLQLHKQLSNYNTMIK